MTKKLSRFILPSLVAALACLVLFPTLTSDFTNLDDQVLVYDNPRIMSLSAENLKEVFTGFHYGLYHPLVLLSYALEFRLFGLAPEAYHATNLALHLLNGMIVYWLFLLLTGRRWTAFIVSLFFAVHPLHVESVAWISERKDVLYAFFYLLSLTGYAVYVKNGQKKYFVAASLLFVCSLLSKPMAVTLPAVLLLFDYLLGRKFTIRVVAEKIPLFALSLVFSLFTVSGHYSAQGKAEIFSSPFYQNIFTASHNLLFYLGKTFVPVKLSCLYPLPVSPGEPLPVSLFFAPFLVAFLAVLVLFTRRYTKTVIFGFLFYLVTLSPAVNLIPVGLGVPADRFTYVPLLGIFFILGEGFARLYASGAGRPLLLRAGLLALLAAAGGTLSVLARQRSEVWRNSIALYTDVLAHYPGSSIAWNNRGLAYTDLKEFDKAMADLNRALELNPRYAEACLNRGNIYKRRKEYGRALEDYEQALRINPSYLEAYINCGNIYRERNEDEAAFRYYNHALKLDPRSYLAYYNRGTLYFKAREFGKALEDYNETVRLNPCFKEAYNNRGAILGQQGELERALADYMHAVSIDPGYRDAIANYAMTLSLLGRDHEALGVFARLIALDPSRAASWAGRGNIYGLLKEYDRALADYARAMELDPEYGEAYARRAVARLFLKDYTGAWQDVAQAEQRRFAVDPEFLELLEEHAPRKSSRRAGS